MNIHNEDTKIRPKVNICEKRKMLFPLTAVLQNRRIVYLYAFVLYFLYQCERGPKDVRVPIVYIRVPNNIILCAAHEYKKTKQYRK